MHHTSLWEGIFQKTAKVGRTKIWHQTHQPEKKSNSIFLGEIHTPPPKLHSRPLSSFPRSHVQHVHKAMNERKAQEGEKIKRWEKMFSESDPLYQAYHNDPNTSIWRRISPCLHHWSVKCPLGQKCGFPKEGQITGPHQEKECVNLALTSYRELERMVDASVHRMIEKRTQRESNEKLLALPIERFLLQYRLKLKRELCRNPNCKREDDGCDRAHSVWELFRQFDQPFLREYYSHHFSPVRPVLENKSSHKLELVCLSKFCRSQKFQRTAVLILTSNTGELVNPRISLICSCCGGLTHFLVYYISPEIVDTT